MFFLANLPKEIVHQDFNSVFLEYMDRPRQTREPLMVFKISRCSSNLYLNPAFVKKLKENNSKNCIFGYFF